MNKKMTMEAMSTLMDFLREMQDTNRYFRNRSSGEVVSIIPEEDNAAFVKVLDLGWVHTKDYDGMDLSAPHLTDQWEEISSYEAWPETK